MYTHSKAMPGSIWSCISYCCCYCYYHHCYFLEQDGGHFKQRQPLVWSPRGRSNKVHKRNFKQLSTAEYRVLRQEQRWSGKAWRLGKSIWHLPQKSGKLWGRRYIIIWWGLHFTMTATWKAVKENDQKVTEGHVGKGWPRSKLRREKWRWLGNFMS